VDPLRFFCLKSHTSRRRILPHRRPLVSAIYRSLQPKLSWSSPEPTDGLQRSVSRQLLSKKPKIQGLGVLRVAPWRTVSTRQNPPGFVNQGCQNQGDRKERRSADPKGSTSGKRTPPIVFTARGRRTTSRLHLPERARWSADCVRLMMDDASRPKGWRDEKLRKLRP
jgi:hypothetical protein